jgi:eukaryotic-like serine/threonine-protein kinase
VAVFICQGCGAEHTSWAGQCPACGTSQTIRLAPATDRMVGRVVTGKFKIVRKLGQGGMGAVYLAEQLGLGHRVALKFLRAEFSSDVEICRRFLNEAKSYARVAHPNAVGLQDFGQDDEGNLFIAMEFCEGVDLKKLIAEKGRLTPQEAIEIALQVADVLANAHEKGVVHRDLKPENIMIRRGMRGVHVKVLDFGIAHLMDAGTRLTVAGAIAGTPRYMPPEQVEGRAIDHRADIYSLGICLFESLTGRQPYDGTTIAEILRKQVLEPLPALKAAAAELDAPELDAVLQRACAKQATARYEDMLAFADALSKARPSQAHSAALAPAPVLSQTLPDLGATQQTVLSGTDASEIKVAKSKAPFVVLAIGVAGVSAAVGFGMLRPSPLAQVPVAEASVAVHEGTPAAVPEMIPTGAAIKALQEQNAFSSLGQGKSAFEVANFDTAQTYLKAVPEDSTAAGEALSVLQKIDLIRRKVKTAQGLRASGKCDQALPIFREVLELNARVRDALDGVSACHQSVVAPTME